jgi:hypothetical protein
MRSPLSAFLLLSCLFPPSQAIGAVTEGPNVRKAAAFHGVDIGEQINAAYADLPATGGAILLEESAAFSTPIVFGADGKPALLIGLPGDIVTLTYTGNSGTAITFDCGRGHRMGYGMRDLTLTGPGSFTDTRGVQFGGANGAEGITLRDFKIESFGTNLQMGSHTWLAYFDHGMIRDGGTNLLLPSGLLEAGEQIVFNHVTFADAPAPHTNSVWVQGGGQEVVFSDCSFDQVQLRIGNNNVSAAQVVVKGSHFENPNFQTEGSVAYDYVTVDNHPGNLLRVSDSYFLQDAPSRGPARFMMLNGGRVVVNGVGMFTPTGAPMRNFALLANNAQVSTYGFNDLSGNITGAQFGH